jgi:hypothetical protein
VRPTPYYYYCYVGKSLPRWRLRYCTSSGQEITAEQESTVDALKKACPGFAVMRSLMMSFRTILRTGKIKTLHAWMKKAAASGIYRMQRFVRTLQQDQSAVEAAVEQTWSNGPVEGHINRLKTLQRQMYGRAGFELLRARVLPLRLLPACTKFEEELNNEKRHPYRARQRMNATFLRALHPQAQGGQFAHTNEGAKVQNQFPHHREDYVY